MTNNHFNPSLDKIADQAMKDKGFICEFPQSVVDQAATLEAPIVLSSSPPVSDLRHLLWISIDNDDSLDLDQLTYAEKQSDGTDQIYIAIADVAHLVKIDSPIDAYAAHNTTSVYTPTKNFPMLPPKLSTNLSSLNEGVDRSAIVVEINVDRSGEFIRWNIYPAVVRNRGKLAYNGVAAYLERKQGSYSLQVAKQLFLQDEIAERIRGYRIRQGALTFASTEAEPILEDHHVIGLVEKVHNRAHRLIENFMIAANVAVSRYCNEHGLPAIRRVVKKPKRWERIVDIAREKHFKLPATPDPKALRDFLFEQEKKDPDHFPDLSLAIIKLIGRGEYVLALPGKPPIGHFDLALLYYAHSTAPNRRFPDLVMQRLIKSSLYKDTLPYTTEELKKIASRCTEKEADAAKVERRVRKSAAAIVLSKDIGKTFEAFVTGSSEKGTWVRLFKPPIEGKLVDGFQGVDVGDHLLVTLTHVDIPNGFIDFKKLY